jgi:hypothetical protein
VPVLGGSEQQSFEQHALLMDSAFDGVGPNPLAEADYKQPVIPQEDSYLPHAVQEQLFQDRDAMVRISWLERKILEQLESILLQRFRKSGSAA